MSMTTIDANRLAIERATVEIMAVRVGNKTMTIAVYEQLPLTEHNVRALEHALLIPAPDITVLGRIYRDRRSCYGDGPCSLMHLLIAEQGVASISHIWEYIDFNDATIREIWDGYPDYCEMFPQVYIAA